MVGLRVAGAGSRIYRFIAPMVLRFPVPEVLGLEEAVKGLKGYL